jgi:adenylate cyclase
MASLLIKPPFDKEYKVELKKSKVTIGRLSDNDIVIKDNAISRSHAEILLKDNHYVIMDLGTRNGTWLNGKRIVQSSIKNKDTIRLGETTLTFKEDTSQIIMDKDRDAEAMVVKTRDSATVMFDKDLLTRIKSIKEKDPTVDHNTALLQKNHKKLLILFRTLKSISSVFDRDTLLSSIMDLAFEVIPATRGLIMLKDEKTDQLLPIVVRQKNKKEKGSIRISQTIVNTVMKDGKSILSSNTSSDERFKEAKSIVISGIKSAICVPLQGRDRTMGVLHVDSDISKNSFTEDDLELLQAMAKQAALAIENIELIQKIRAESEIRNNLQRYLSPSLVDNMIKEKPNMEVDLAGEIKEATVLIADIRDFTRMSEKMPPKEIMELLNEYFSAMTHIIFKYEGTVDKYLGDALLTVFGSPFKHKDDEKRALYAAIDMQDKVKEINKIWQAEKKQPLSIGIGICTGKIIHGNVGSKQRLEFTIIGDTVNIASRLSSITKSGQILATNTTLKGIEHLINFKKLEPIKVKGKEKEINIAEILGRKK